MGKREYDELSAYYHADEENRYHQSDIYVPKPWRTFTEDVKDIEQEILVAHYTANPMGKQTKKKLRDGQGRIVRDAQGQPLYTTGDTARGALHMDTQYGAIKQDGEIKYVLRMAIGDSRVKVENIVDPVVRQKVQDAIDRYGSIAKALEAGPIWMNEEKGVAIKKVRTITSVTDPLHIRRQRDVSKHEYKRTFHVNNDTNDLFLIYEGKDNKGELKRSFDVVSNIEAAKRYNSKGECEVIPQTSKEGYPLKMVLRVGTLILLYRENPNELYLAEEKELIKRFYKVIGFGKDGRIKIRYQQEAREAKDLGGFLALDYNMLENEVAQARVGYAKLNALVQGQDFEISDTGKITFK